MAYLDHIRACNDFDPAGFRPFRAGADRIGYVRHALAEELRRWPDVFWVATRAVSLDTGLADFEARPRAVAAPLRGPASAGRVEAWSVAPRSKAHPSELQTLKGT